eukprot:XP_019082284.1 PREDICTED: uncharacterized protein LOC100242012 [Vitis vinifera]
MESDSLSDQFGFAFDGADLVSNQNPQMPSNQHIQSIANPSSEGMEMGPLSGSNQAVINQGNWNEDPPFSGHNNIGQLLDTQLETSAFNAYHPDRDSNIIQLQPSNYLVYGELPSSIRRSGRPNVNHNLMQFTNSTTSAHQAGSSFSDPPSKPKPPTTAGVVNGNSSLVNRQQTTSHTQNHAYISLPPSRMCGHRSDHLLDHQASQGLMVPYVLNPQHPNSIPLQSDEPLRYGQHQHLNNQVTVTPSIVGVRLRCSRPPQVSVTFRPRTQVPTAQYVQEGPNSMQLVGSSMPSSSSRPQQVRCHHHNQLNQAQMVPTVKDPQKQNYTLAGPSMLSSNSKPTEPSVSPWPLRLHLQELPRQTAGSGVNNLGQGTCQQTQISQIEPQGIKGHINLGLTAPRQFEGPSSTSSEQRDPAQRRARARTPVELQLFPERPSKMARQEEAPPASSPPQANIISPIQGNDAQNSSRQVRNGLYDPSYEAIGLPIDPHLRLFALQKKNRKS